jgi:hypothetical protein
MKKAHLILGTVIATLCSNPIQAQTVVSDSVAMGAGYGKAVYYNIRTGAEASAPIDQWHFSHTTVSRDNCIRVNHMGGVEVYAYPKGDNTALGFITLVKTTLGPKKQSSATSTPL